jgi:FkbM family methyltransferase
MLRRIRHAIPAMWKALDLRGRQRQLLAGRIRALKAGVKAAEIKWAGERAALKRVSAERHRLALSPALLRGLLPLRAQTIAVRARHENAERYDLLLQETAPAYRAELADTGEADSELERITLDTLGWSVAVPASVRAGARERFIAKQQFPYRAIVQTREMAQGPVLIDVGANMGLTSVPRVVLGDFARAYCAEPDPLNYRALVRNVVDNGLRGLVLPDQVAIGDTDGPVLLRHAKYSGGHRVSSEPHPWKTIQVQSRTLNQWCREMRIDLDLVTFVKVDTQGSEVKVLRGAADLLARRHIAWQLEVAPAWLESAGTSAAELYAICAEHFTHFIDLGKDTGRRRVRPAAELAEALAYLQARNEHTDILVYCGAP